MRMSINMKDLDLTNEIGLEKEEITDYVERKIEHALLIFDEKEPDVNVRLKTEGEFGRIVQKVEININVGGKHIRQSSHSRSVLKAIDRAESELRRQVQKYKTKRIDYRRGKSAADKQHRNQQYAASLVEEEKITR